MNYRDLPQSQLHELARSAALERLVATGYEIVNPKGFTIPDGRVDIIARHIRHCQTVLVIVQEHIYPDTPKHPLTISDITQARLIVGYYMSRLHTAIKVRLDIVNVIFGSETNNTDINFFEQPRIVEMHLSHQENASPDSSYDPAYDLHGSYIDPRMDENIKDYVRDLMERDAAKDPIAQVADALATPPDLSKLPTLDYKVPEHIKRILSRLEQGKFTVDEAAKRVACWYAFQTKARDDE